MHRKKYSERADGFSLIEMMIAVFILAVGLLATAQLMTMAVGLDALARSKSMAVPTIQNEIERLSDLYRRNPAADELTVGTHQAAELVEIRNPLNQNVLNRYKITWSVGDMPYPRPGIDLSGKIISVRATPMLTESRENTYPFQRKTTTLNAVITAER